jgi:hypothetical protein
MDLMYQLTKNNLVETTYDIKNELPMFVIGLNYSFAKK